MPFEPALLAAAGAVAVLLAVLIVYAVVSPGGRARGRIPPLAMSPGRVCMYCRSSQTRRVGQAPRYDDHGFALITSYECIRCGLPFWSVDRSPAQQRSHGRQD
ncbi:MAG TPA: hypothetical protein VFB34_11655 [Chloroflexota bacterium]|nr:hypothetical protein [Chloroflexota bacterium]